MISKIIQKEKDRQDYLIKCLGSEEKNGPLIKGNRVSKIVFHAKNAVHKQSLINLKEYLEEELKSYPKLLELLNNDSPELSIACDRIKQLKEDIQELNNMIGEYE